MAPQLQKEPSRVRAKHRSKHHKSTVYNEHTVLEAIALESA